MALLMYICKNCGTTIDYDSDEINKKCHCTEPNFISLGANPKEYFNLSPKEKTTLIQKKLRLNDNQFSEIQQEWKQSQSQNSKSHYAERIAQRNMTRNANQLKCPYCNSINISKISTLNRAVSVGVFGLSSSKVGKQWHCNKCKSDF